MRPAIRADPSSVKNTDNPPKRIAAPLAWASRVLNEAVMGFLSKQFADLKESVKSQMAFHMDLTSFEMNKFMKLLAVVGFLGLIPSVAGGLLGMNVAGNPWAVTLGQVAFGIGMGMAITLYVFAIKGWLR